MREFDVTVSLNNPKGVSAITEPPAFDRIGHDGLQKDMTDPVGLTMISTLRNPIQFTTIY
ncbi:MAG: hypothetical protein ABJO27_08600 [Pseudoruegeria sp.]